MSADLIEILSQSTGNYVHNLSTYKSTKINEHNNYSNKHKQNNNNLNAIEYQNMNKLNHYNNNGSFYDLLKKKKTNNCRNKQDNLKDKNIPENKANKNGKKKELISKDKPNNHRKDTNNINYSPSEIKNPRSLSNRNLISRNDDPLNSKKNHNKNENEELRIKKKEINNYSINNKADKETIKKLERLKNFDSLHDLFKNKNSDLIGITDEIRSKKKNGFIDENNKKINKSLKTISHYNNRKNIEVISKLNRELEKNEMKLLGKKKKNFDDNSHNYIPVSKDFIDGTIWCSRCKGFHEENAHKKILKNSFNNTNEKSNNNYIENSNENKYLDISIKKKILNENPVEQKNNVFNHNNKIQNKNSKKENFDIDNEIKINNSSNSNKQYNPIPSSINQIETLNRIKNAIKPKQNFKNVETSNNYEILNSNKLEKENYTENFEDIDYELENNDDHNNRIITFNNNNKSNEQMKTPYSPSDNLNSNNLKSTKNNDKIKNDVYSPSTTKNQLNHKINKIDYSPSENLNFGKSNYNNKQISFNQKIEANPIFRNYDNEHNKEFNDEDIKINKINKINFDKLANINTSRNEEKNKISQNIRESNKIDSLKIAQIKNLIIQKSNKIKNGDKINLIKDHIVRNNYNNENKLFSKNSQNGIQKLNVIPQTKNNRNEENPTNKQNFKNKEFLGHIKNISNQNSIRPGTNVISSNINHIRNGSTDQKNKNNSNNDSKIDVINGYKNNRNNSNPSINKNGITLNHNNRSDFNKKYLNNNSMDESLNKQNTNSKNIFDSSKPTNKYNNFSQFSEPLPPSLQKVFYPSQNNNNNKPNNLYSNPNKRYRDETDRKFAEIFGAHEMTDFICDEEDENQNEYKKHLISIKNRLSRGNNRQIIQDYSDDSISEANFEQIEKEERISSWIAEKEDMEEEIKLEREREKRRMKKKMRMNIDDSENSIDNEEEN